MLLNLIRGLLDWLLRLLFGGVSGWRLEAQVVAAVHGARVQVTYDVRRPAAPPLLFLWLHAHGDASRPFALALVEEPAGMFEFEIGIDGIPADTACEITFVNGKRERAPGAPSVAVRTPHFPEAGRP